MSFDDDEPRGKRDGGRERRPKRGGRREFGNDSDFGGPPPDPFADPHFGNDDSGFGGGRSGGGYRGGGGGGGYRGGGDRDGGGGGYRGGGGGGYRGGGDRDGGGGGYRGGGGGGYRGGGDRDGGGGGYRGGGGGGYRGGGDRDGGGGGYRGGGGGGGYRGGGDRDGGGGGYRGGGGGGGGFRGGGGGGGYRGGGGGGDRDGGGRPPRQPMQIEKEGVTGVIKFFNQDRGFGFITPDDGSDDVFVHISSIERSGIQQVEDGMKLTFDLAADNRGKGPKAVNLKLMDSDGAAADDNDAEDDDY